MPLEPPFITPIGHFISNNIRKFATAGELQKPQIYDPGLFSFRPINDRSDRSFGSAEGIPLGESNPGSQAYQRCEHSQCSHFFFEVESLRLS